METKKKYLKTIEEVSDALAAGKVVYGYDGATYKKDRNGFIIKESKCDSTTIGVSISLIDVPYILEQNHLEVKLWHLYENKKGEAVLIFKKYKSGLFGFLGISKEYDDLSYAENGECIIDPDNENLVKELADLSEYFK